MKYPEWSEQDKYLAEVIADVIELGAGSYDVDLVTVDTAKCLQLFADGKLCAPANVLLHFAQLPNMELMCIAVDEGLRPVLKIDSKLTWISGAPMTSTKIPSMQEFLGDSV